MNHYSKKNVTTQPLIFSTTDQGNKRMDCDKFFIARIVIK